MSPHVVWTEERIQKAKRALTAWHGTPHKNRIAIRGQGIDCIQFVVEVGAAAGVWPRVNFSGYPLTDGMGIPSDRLKQLTLRCTFSHWVDVSEPFQFGDLAIFKNGECSAHCGFIDDADNVWHSLAGHSVTRSQLILWRKRIAGAVRLDYAGWRVNPESVSAA